MRLSSNENLKLGLPIAFTYVGGVIGAGFASGQEIWCFFGSFGNKGLFGSILAGLLFAFFGMAILDFAYRYQTPTHEALFQVILGKRAGCVADWLLTLFLYAVLIIMGAGSGTIFAEYLGSSYLTGVLALLVITALCLVSGLEGLFWANSVLVPLMAFLFLIIAVRAFTLEPTSRVETAANTYLLLPHWALAACLYVAYNLGLVFAVFANLGTEINCQRQLRMGSMLGGGVLGAFVFLLTLMEIKTIGAADTAMPMLFLAAQIGPQAKYLYALILWVAIVTTNLAAVYGFANRIRVPLKWSWRKSLVLTLVSVILPAQLGFVRLISVIYPLFGYLGGGLLIALLVKQVCYRCPCFWVSRKKD